jgi:site-specific DNA recombinase
MKLVVHDADDRRRADPGLLRIIARAHDFQERLMQDPDLTVPSIASQERLTIGYLSFPKIISGRIGDTVQPGQR